MSVEINATNFPDDNLRDYISTNFDQDSDGFLSSTEIEQALTISINAIVYTLRGIEYLTSLKRLYVNHYIGQIGVPLTINGHPSLERIELQDANQNSQVEEISITNCPKLVDIDARWRKALVTLDASDNPLLDTLICNSSDTVRSVIFDNCPSLRKFSIYHDDNYSNALDFSNCPNIEHVDCFYCNVPALNFSGCSKLKYVDASYNRNLSSVDLTGCTSLRLLDLQNTGLTSLTLPKAPKLHGLEVNDTPLEYLNIFPCGVMADLYAVGSPVRQGDDIRWTRSTTVDESDYSHDIRMHNSTQSADFSYDRLTAYKDTIITLSALTITKQPEDLTLINTDESGDISVEVTGEDLTYSWEVLKPDEELWEVIQIDGDDATYTVENIPSNDGAQFRCRISTPSGAMGLSNVAHVTILYPPSIEAQPQSQTVIEDATATFSIEANNRHVEYQWQASSDNGVTWTDIYNETEDTYEVTATMGLNGYKYRCNISNVLGSVTSDPATLTVTPDTRINVPTITTQPASVSVLEGSAASFSVIASGQDLHYQWQTNQNGTWYNIDGATSSSYSTVAAMILNQSKYRCQVSNSAGSLYSNEVILSVTSEQSIRTPTITSQPRSVTVEEGQQATFRVSASGGSLSYQWQVKRSGVWYEITGAESATLYVRGASDTNNNQYRCLVANSAGLVYSTIATLSVRETGPLTFYGYHSIIISGKNTYGEWEMYPTSRPHVAPPEVKTSYVDVPGADGGLDYTELLNGKPNYGYRKGSWEFLLIPQERWPEVYRSLCNFLHGREHTIVLEDDPKWTYRGRLSVNEWRSAAHNSLITIDYILDPIATSTDDEGYDPDADDLDAAGRILRKPGNEDSAIILWNGTETVVPIDSLFEDGDSILY